MNQSPEGIQVIVVCVRLAQVGLTTNVLGVCLGCPLGTVCDGAVECVDGVVRILDELLIRLLC